MAIRHIIQNGDMTLRQKSQPVTEINDKIIQLLDDMKDTLKKAEGAGLAAVQVGILKRVFIVDIEEGYFEFINPVIVSEKGKQYGVEGCLSVSGVSGYVTRPKQIVIKAQDRTGKTFRMRVNDFFAKAVSHEYDHLEGILFIDKADNIK